MASDQQECDSSFDLVQCGCDGKFEIVPKTDRSGEKNKLPTKTVSTFIIYLAVKSWNFPV